MLDATPLGQPSLPPRAVRMRARARALLAAALLAGPLGLAPVSKAQLLEGEVCRVDAIRATSVWSCAASPTNTVFWVPCTSGDLALDVSSGTKSLIVYSTDTGRRLTVNGTTGNDILVGSPTTSETLRGGNGRNTYIVGGANTYTAASGDAILLTATSKEKDSVRLSSPLPDYIHINAPAQSNPGWLITATSPALPVQLRGSSDLGGVSGCPSAFFRFPPALRNAPTARLAMGASDVSCGFCDASASARETKPEDFPGVTTIEGFDLHPERGDRIVLPAEPYRFLGKSLEGRAVIPTLLVQDARFRPGGGLVTEEELRRVLREASGLQRIRSAQAPLVYFPQNGLLVFSQNAEPLGSRQNPGRVIARLLDGDGRPLQLPQPAAAALFPARFVAFTPAPPRTTAGPLAPQLR